MARPETSGEVRDEVARVVIALASTCAMRRLQADPMVLVPSLG